MCSKAEGKETASRELIEETGERFVKSVTEEAAEKTLQEGESKFLGICADGINCFTAGTKVSTIDGEKNIEDIKKGDYVL